MSTPLSSPKSLGVSKYDAADTDRHSTLEPVQNYSTLEAVPYRADEDRYGAKHMVAAKTEGCPNDLEGGAVGRQGGFWKRKVCGVSMVVVAIILTIFILGAVGGGVGGALASKNSRDTAKKDSDPAPIPVSTVINGDGETVTITATPTTATDIVTGAPSSTSTRPLPLPPYPTKALAANSWHKIGISRRSFGDSAPQQLEARWADFNALGSIGIAPNSSEADQTWQLLAVPQSNENSKRVYENEAEAGGLTALYYVACMRFTQQVRMVVDNADVDRYKDSGDGSIGITMARADNAESGQYWWLEEVESEVEGDPLAFVLHNLKSGKGWRLKWSANAEGVLVANMQTGEPKDTNQIKLRDDVWDVTKLGKIGSQEGWFIYD